jgi:hypothetical protein
VLISADMANQRDAELREKYARIDAGLQTDAVGIAPVINIVRPNRDAPRDEAPALPTPADDDNQST